MSYLHLSSHIPKQVHALLSDSRMTNLNQSECKEVVQNLRLSVIDALRYFHEGEFHDCFDREQFLQAFINRVVDTRWSDKDDLQKAILKVANTMIKMPLIPLLHVFLEDKQLDDDINDLCNFLGVETNRDYAFVFQLLKINLQTLLEELNYIFKEANNIKEFLFNKLLKHLCNRERLVSFNQLTVLGYFNQATQDIIFELRLIHMLHVFLEDKQLDNDINDLCYFLGVESDRDYAFVFDLLTKNLQTLLIQFNDPKLNYTKEVLFNKLLDHLYTRNKLDSFHQLTVLGYFNQVTQDIIFELRPFNDQAADIFAVTNHQQWKITFELIQSLLTELINKTQRDPYLLSQELQYEIKILDKHSMFSEEDVVADLHGIYRKIRKKYPYHPTTAPTETPAWQPAVSEFEELNYGDTKVETPAFEYHQTDIHPADKNSYTEENQEVTLNDLFPTEELKDEFKTAIYQYKSKHEKDPICRPMIDGYMRQVVEDLLEEQLKANSEFNSSKDIQRFIMEVHSALINIQR